MGSKQKVSGPMVLVASLASRNGHRGGRVGRLAGTAVQRARSAAGLEEQGPGGFPEVLETAGALISAAAVAVAVVARFRGGSNGGDE